MGNMKIDEFKELCRKSAVANGKAYWFADKFMEMFGTEILATRLYKNRWFVSSDCWVGTDERLYTINEVNLEDYTVQPLDPIQGFKTFDEAQTYMREHGPTFKQ